MPTAPVALCRTNTPRRSCLRGRRAQTGDHRQGAPEHLSWHGDLDYLEREVATRGGRSSPLRNPVVRAGPWRRSGIHPEPTPGAGTKRRISSTREKDC